MIMEQIEILAEQSAIAKGYHQSDKEHLETTPWTQHNIYVQGFIDGYDYHKQESEGLREEVERLKETLRVTENQAKLYYNLYQTKGRYVDPELHTMD